MAQLPLTHKSAPLPYLGEGYGQAKKRSLEKVSLVTTLQRGPVHSPLFDL